MTEARTNEEVIQEFRDAGGISADMIKAITPDALETIDREKVAKKLEAIWKFLGDETNDLKTTEMVYLGCLLHTALSNEIADWLKAVTDYKGKRTSNVIQFKDPQ